MGRRAMDRSQYISRIRYDCDSTKKGPPTPHLLFILSNSNRKIEKVRRLFIFIVWAGGKGLAIAASRRTHRTRSPSQRSAFMASGDATLRNPWTSAHNRSMRE